MDIRKETINRMLRILEMFSRKFKIAICLPTLLEQSKFKNVFKDNKKELKKISKLCIDTNRENEQSHNGDDASNNEHLQIALLGDKQPTLEMQWAVVLESLSKYESEILSIINDVLDDIHPSHINAIHHVELLKQLTEWQMKSTPKQLRERKIELRSAEALIMRTQEDIENVENGFNDETLKHNEIVKKSQAEIDDLKLVIDEIKRKHNEELDHEMNRYKTILRGLKDDIIEEEKMLNNQLAAHEVMLEKFMQANIEQEKALRQHCIKTEKKYLAARNAYDRDLTKLHELKDSLEMQLRLTNHHYEILKNEYDVQGVLYTNLKKERELAMMQAFAEQLDNFEKNRAARIIQRTWRAYHERISSKKKKRTRRNK